MNGFVKGPARAGKTGFSKMCGRHLSAAKSEAHGHDLRLLARRGLWQLSTFVAVSVLFFSLRHVDLLAPLAENIRQVLGCPPPATLTTLALAGYSISAAVLLVSRIIGGVLPCLKWSYLGYRLVFYLFYSFSNSLDEYFMGVFVAGLILFGLEQVNIVTCSFKSQPRKGALLGKL